MNDIYFYKKLYSHAYTFEWTIQNLQYIEYDLYELKNKNVHSVKYLGRFAYIFYDSSLNPRIWFWVKLSPIKEKGKFVFEDFSKVHATIKKIFIRLNFMKIEMYKQLIIHTFLVLHKHYRMFQHFLWCLKSCKPGLVNNIF